MLSVAIKACQLETIGNIRTFVFTVASDRTKITNLHQVIVGFKVVDVGAIDPLNNRLVKPQTTNAC